MHDPMTLAFSINRPWPQIRKAQKRDIERYGNSFHWQIRIFSKHRYISPFIYAFGKELYFPEVLGIWHTDPLGDAGPACHGRKHWKWHLHHMSISPSFWYEFRQKRITKCAWCGKKSSKELGRVNHSDHRTVYHSKCLHQKSLEYHAHDPATCWSCKRTKEAL